MAKSANGVFISYRRGESGHVAGRLAERLRTRLSTTRVFIDVDRINPGEDFSIAVRRAVQGSAVLIAIIGPQWLKTLRYQDTRRFDWVRHELAMALSRGVTVIPVLVDGATMPEPTDLPTELQGLSTRNAVTIGLTTFPLDIDRLVGVIMQRREISATPRRNCLFVIVMLLYSFGLLTLMGIGGLTDNVKLIIAVVVIVLVSVLIFFVVVVVALIRSRLRRKHG